MGDGTEDSEEWREVIPSILVGECVKNLDIDVTEM